MVSEIAEESGGESDDEVPEETKMVDDPSCLIENESESFAYTVYSVHARGILWKRY